MNESYKMVVVLVLVCVVSALVLSIVYSVTQPMILENRQSGLQQAISRVHLEAVSSEPLGVSKDMIQEVYKLSDESENDVGYAVLIEFTGFQGPIKTVYGLDDEMMITGVEVLEHAETPGLGSKIQDPLFVKQFVGKNKENYQIDTITGATISTSALAEAVKQTLSDVEGLV